MNHDYNRPDSTLASAFSFLLRLTGTEPRLGVAFTGATGKAVSCLSSQRDSLMSSLARLNSLAITRTEMLK
jgi:hypothetical protein